MSRAPPTTSPNPDAGMVSVSAFDLLQIELVPQAYRLHTDLLARHTELAPQAELIKLFASGGGGRKKRRALGDRRRGLDGMGGRGTGPAEEGGVAQTQGQAQVVHVGQQQQQQVVNAGLGIEGGVLGQVGAGPETAAGTVAGVEGEDEEEDGGMREAVFHRLEAQGYRVGQGLVEAFSVDQARPTTDLDKIKFICKDLWTRAFRKQIDNLKTNHRGTFVLTDARFAPLSRMSVDRKAGPKGLDQALSRAQAFLWFPCGIIRGALQGLGMDVTVNAETTDLPVAVFQIRLVGSKP